METRTQQGGLQPEPQRSTVRRLPPTSMTVMSLSILLECYVATAFTPPATAVHREAANFLLRHELIEWVDARNPFRGYAVTPEGRAYIAACLALPLRNPAGALKREEGAPEPTFIYAYVEEGAAQAPRTAQEAFLANLGASGLEMSVRGTLAALFGAMPLEQRRQVLHNLGWREQA